MSNQINKTFNGLNQPVYQRIIQVHETDKDGVVHFSNYLKIAEEALFSGFRTFGYPFEETEYSLAMLNVTVNYIHPMRFSDHIFAVFTNIDVQRIKIGFVIKLIDENNNCLASISLKMAIIEIAKRNAIAIPEALKQALTRAINQ